MKKLIHQTNIVEIHYIDRAMLGIKFIIFLKAFGFLTYSFMWSFTKSIDVCTVIITPFGTSQGPAFSNVEFLSKSSFYALLTSQHMRKGGFASSHLSCSSRIARYSSVKRTIEKSVFIKAVASSSDFP